MSSTDVRLQVHALETAQEQKQQWEQWQQQQQQQQQPRVGMHGSDYVAALTMLLLACLDGFGGVLCRKWAS